MLKASSAESETSEKIEALFTGLLEFPVFRTAPVLSSILAFLWQHKGESVGEYSIAVDALGRSPNFDPKTDASVRVLIGRLRARLKEFNADESYPLKLTIPLGTHEIHWSLNETVPEAPAPIVVPPAPYRSLFYGSAALCVVFALICVALLERNTRQASVAHRAEASVPRFWKSFLVGGKSPVVVLPSLIHFSWPKVNVSMRDLSVEEFADWPRSAHVKDMAKIWGPPELNQAYVGVGDTQAGVQLLNYFNSVGLHADLLDSGHYQGDAPGARSTIFIGAPYRIPSLSVQLAECDFYMSDPFGAGPVVVHNRNPKLGEPEEYREIDYSPTHQVFPELILFLPPTPDGGRTLIMLGRNAIGLAAMLSTEAGLARLDEEWQKIGSPAAWEMVVQEEVNQNTVLKVRPIAMRPLSPGQ